MENFIKFVEEIKKRKDFNEIEAYYFWYSAVNDFLSKKLIDNSYEFYYETILKLDNYINNVSDNDLKIAMNKFLNYQSLQNANEILQKIQISTRKKAINEFINILNKNNYSNLC